MIKLLNILSEQLGFSDDNSVVGFEFKSMKPYRKKGRDGNYIPGHPWYVYFNGLKLVKGIWSPGDNFIVELTGDGEHFELRPQEFRYNQQTESGSIPLDVLQRDYPRLNIFEKNDNIVTPLKIRQALKIAFEDSWLEGDDIYSPGIRGIYTIGDKTGTDESWSVTNYFDTKKEVQKEINKKWKREGKGDFIYWLADVFKNDIEFMNNLVERQWQSISNGYENERKVAEILSNELGGDSQLFPPGSKKDRYELIDMIINGNNYQIKPSSSINKENGVWKVITYGMNNRYKGKNLQYIAYGTNDNKVYVFPNKNYNVSDSRYVEHYEDPLIYPNNQLSEQVSPKKDKLIKKILREEFEYREQLFDLLRSGDKDNIEMVKMISKGQDINVIELLIEFFKDNKPPYFKILKHFNLPEEEMDYILLELFGEPVNKDGEYIYNQNGNLIYEEYSYGYWGKYEYDDNENKIYSENSYGDWRKHEYDENGNEIYYEDSDGDWSKYQYDDNGNEIYYEDSDGYWSKYQYDDNGNEIYFENSYGHIRDNR